MTAPVTGDAALGGAAPPAVVAAGDDQALQQQFAAFSLHSSTSAAAGSALWPSTSHWPHQQPLGPTSSGSGPLEGPEHAAAGGAGQAESGPSTAPVPMAPRLPGEGAGSCPLARELGVSLASLVRLFTADRSDEFDQPVWMVVNLQVRSSSGLEEHASPAVVPSLGHAYSNHMSQVAAPTSAGVCASRAPCSSGWRHCRYRVVYHLVSGCGT
jgi:hypothetical protein